VVWTVSRVNFLLFGKSVHQLSCVLESHYSDCVLGWKVIIALLLCAGQWIQQFCCGFDIEYSSCVVGWTVSQRLYCGSDSH